MHKEKRKDFFTYLYLFIYYSPALSCISFLRKKFFLRLSFFNASRVWGFFYHLKAIIFIKLLLFAMFYLEWQFWQTMTGETGNQQKVFNHFYTILQASVEHWIVTKIARDHSNSTVLSCGLNHSGREAPLVAGVPPLLEFLPFHIPARLNLQSCNLKLFLVIFLLLWVNSVLLYKYPIETICPHSSRMNKEA